MADVLLGFGSNVGDKAANIRAAVSALAAKCEVVQISRLYRTAPVGYLDQDWFLNAAAWMRTPLSPVDLLGLIRKVEQDLGRERSIPNGPRTIDIDILFYDQQVIQQDDLIIPHPRMAERAFVLAPLCEIAADARHPQLGKSVSELLNALPEGPAVEVFRSSVSGTAG